MKKILCGQFIPLEKTTDFNPVGKGAPQCGISNWVKRRSSLTGFLVMLILFLWCTKAWAPFPMTQMESGEIKVDMPQKEEIIEETTAPPAVKFSREEKRTVEPAADISRPFSADAGSETGGGFFTQEPQVEHKASETENKVIEKEIPLEETAGTEKIKSAFTIQLILDAVIIVFAVVILLTLIYLSRKGRR